MSFLRSVKQFFQNPAVQGAGLFWLAVTVWDGISTFANTRFFPLIQEGNRFMWGAVRGLPDFHNFLVVKAIFTVGLLLPTVCLHKAHPKWAWLPYGYYGMASLEAALGNTLIFWRLHG